MIKALQNATEPSLKECQITWGEGVERLEEVFRNQSIVSTKIMPQIDFDSMCFAFYSEQDPFTKQPINKEFTSADFVEVTGESG